MPSNATNNTTKKVKIAGNAMVITSKLKFDEIKKMEKYNPAALVLIEKNDEETNEVFRISTGKVSSFSQYGITYSEANANGFATATILLDHAENKKAYVKDKYATALIILGEIEDSVKTACEKLAAEHAKLDEIIEEV